MIKAILFDFDGTLINTNDLIFKSYKVAFQNVFNREIDTEEILNLYGRPLYSSLMQYGEEGKRLYEVYREFNEKNHDFLAKPFDGACEGVRALINKGYRIGIVTSKRMHLVKRGIEKVLFMQDIFDTIITPDDTEKAKPDPEPILLGCEKLGVNPEETVYVGDSIFDMQAGKDAGTQLCAVKYSLTPFEKLLEYKPKYFVDTIEEFALQMEALV